MVTADRVSLADGTPAFKLDGFEDTGADSHVLLLHHRDP